MARILAVLIYLAILAGPAYYLLRAVLELSITVRSPIL